MEMLPGFLLDLLTFGVTPTGAITVNGTGVAYTNSFPLRRGMTFGWEVKFTSPGSVNVKVELEQGNTRPATEGAADAGWAVPDNKAATPLIAAVVDAVTHIQAYAPDATAFGRLKLTGISGNNAGTALTVARVYTIKNV